MARTRTTAFDEQRADLPAIAVADVPSALLDLLTLPASVGEFWMVGYLLIKGIRPEAFTAESSTTT